MSKSTLGPRGRIVGFGWGDLSSAGQTAFPYIHTAGSGVLSAFGAGALMPLLTSAEQSGGLLSKPVVPTSAVQHADFVIFVDKDPSKQPGVISSPDAVAIFGGKRFDGNGYQSVADLGHKFSFGYDAPTSVDVTVQGKKATYQPKQVLLCGGAETKTNIAGDATMSKKGLLSTILGAVGFSDREEKDLRRGRAGDVLGAQIGPGGPTTVHTNRYLSGGLAGVNGAKPPIQATQNSGFKILATPKGRKFTSLQINHRKATTPAQALRTTRMVAQRAQQIGTTALTKLASAEKTLGKKAAILGAAAIKPRTIASIAALKQQAAALVAEGKKLSSTADKYEKVINGDKAKAKAGSLHARQVTHMIHGWGDYEVGSFQPGDGGFIDIVGATWDEIMGFDWEEINGADEEMLFETIEILGQYGPDPTGGYGAPNPYGGMPLPPGGIDPATGLPIDSGGVSSLASQLPGPPDYGAGQPPSLAGGVITSGGGGAGVDPTTGMPMTDGTMVTWPVAGEDYTPDPYPNGDDPQFYNFATDGGLPLGAVIYDGSQQPPHMGLGNWTTYFGMLQGSNAPKGGPGSGYSLHGDGKWWLLLQGTQPSFNYSGGRNYDTVGNPNSAMSAESATNNWGPLIGEPAQGSTVNPEATGGTWTHGLRFSPTSPAENGGGPIWFWYYDTAARVAPWAVAAIQQAQLNQMATQYKAAVVAGQTDYVNAQLQDKLNAQQAAVQAQQQAAVDAQVAQQTEIANAADAASQQQLDTQQAQQQLAQQAQQAQSQAQQEQLAQQAAQLQLQYFSEHPEAMFVPADQGGGGGGGSQQQAEHGDQSDANVDWGASDGGLDDYSENPSADDLTTEADSL